MFTRHGIVCVVALLIGLGIGQYSVAFLPGAASDAQDQTDLAHGYKYINPLLFCSDKELSRSTSALSRAIERDVSEFIEEQKRTGALINAAVYYRDLNGGPWALVNGDLRSAPASLLKVPLAMSVYRRVERNRAFLQTPMHMSLPDQNADVYFKPSVRAEPGQLYTVEELVDLSLKNSDNNATTVLISQLTETELRNSYEDLGIDVPVDNPANYTLSVRTYASFFRILFNASYVSRELSESLLAKLSQSEFRQGIAHGVPNGVAVAHKFGEHRIDETHVQLHDCGIVYRPGAPYLACVMTQGDNFDELAYAIAEISRILWNLQQ